MLVLITGASGSGTSALAAALATDLGIAHLETDDYFWTPTQPPYQVRRGEEERRALLLAAIRERPSAVVAGSVMEWGEELENAFGLIIFLYVATELRIERLRRRETERFGRADPEFLAWAAAYDEGPAEGRSLARHRAWLATRKCPVLELAGDLTVDARVATVRSRIAAMRDAASKA